MTRLLLKVSIAFMLGWLLAPSLAHAQTPVTVTYTVSAPHNGAITTEYRLYFDAATTPLQTKPVADLTGGVITFTGSTTLATGVHAVSVAAANATGEAKSAATSFTVTLPPPNAPGTVVITITVGP